MNSRRLKKAIVQMVLIIGIMIMLPAVLSFTAEYPRPVTDHYLARESIYWKISQVTISPIFDEPETSLVEFYFEKPNKLYLSSLDQKIFAIEDTIWTYLIKHNQIQKSLGGTIFNPFDFIDTSQSVYRVVESDKNHIILKSNDEALEPDSLLIEFEKGGLISSVIYLDTNENEVILHFIEESFDKAIPRDNFLVNMPEGVEIIDISD